MHPISSTQYSVPPVLVATAQLFSIIVTAMDTSAIIPLDNCFYLVAQWLPWPLSTLRLAGVSSIWKAIIDNPQTYRSAIIDLTHMESDVHRSSVLRCIGRWAAASGIHLSWKSCTMATSILNVTRLRYSKQLTDM